MINQWIIEVLDANGLSWHPVAETWFQQKYIDPVRVMVPRTLTECVERMHLTITSRGRMRYYSYRIVNHRTGESIPCELFE